MTLEETAGAYQHVTIYALSCALQPSLRNPYFDHCERSPPATEDSFHQSAVVDWRMTLIGRHSSRCHWLDKEAPDKTDASMAGKRRLSHTRALPKALPRILFESRRKRKSELRRQKLQQEEQRAAQEEGQQQPPRKRGKK